MVYVWNQPKCLSNYLVKNAHANQWSNELIPFNQLHWLNLSHNYLYLQAYIVISNAEVLSDH